MTSPIDTHTHFYDPARPGGVPWPRASERLLYRTVLPRHFRDVAEPCGIFSTVVVEASGWPSDNDWILDLADREPCIAGFIGHVEPGAAFDAEIDRLRARPLFRGVRLSGKHLEPAARDLALRAAERLARADLTLDLIAADRGLEAAAELAEKLPGLSVVVNHLGGVRIDGGPPPADWLDRMGRLASSPGVSCKVSGFLESAASRPGPTAPDYYMPVLDAVRRLFGADRVLFGSNWPVCELGGPYAAVAGVARAFARAHGPDLEARFFRDNAVRAYGLRAAGRAG